MKQFETEILGAKLEGFLHNQSDRFDEKFKSRPAIIICPGGSYQHISVRESEPPALAMFSAGFQTFILSYSVGEESADFLPLRQVSAAISYLRENAQDFNIDREKIAVMGFSAGGHLAASIACLGDYKLVQKDNNKVNLLCLCYPFISVIDEPHQKSIDKITNGDEETKKLFELEKYVKSGNAPTFLWHTAEDSVVPVQNSLSFANSLSEHKVPFELHIYPKGKHGGSICTKEVLTYNPSACAWVQQFIKFAATELEFPFNWQHIV